MTLPYGVLRTPMGAYVLNEDACLSRWVERENRLDIGMNIIEITSFAHRIPEGGVVVDAGACLGDHTLTYSQIVGGLGKVYAFEPHPLTYKALSLNMERLRNVICFNCGLSDVPGNVLFTLDPNIGASCISDDGSVSIEVVTLDEWVLPKVTRCDFIHLDAEGYEPAILRGGRELILKFQPMMLIEVCDKHLRRSGSSETELLGLIDAFGYQVHSIPSHTEAELRDVLCVRKS